MRGHHSHRFDGITFAQRGQERAPRLDGEIVLLAAGGMGKVAHHLHEGRHQHDHEGVVRGLRQEVVEFDVDVDLVVVALGLEQPLRLVDIGGQGVEIRVGAAHAGDLHDGRCEPDACLRQLLERDAAELVEVAEAVADHAGIAAADEGAAPRTRLQRHHAGAFEVAQRFADGAPAYAEILGKLAFGRQLVASAQVARRDAHLDLRRHLVGEPALLDRRKRRRHAVPAESAASVLAPMRSR